MKYLSTFFLLLVYQFSLAQIICDSIANDMGFGDYPPGCFICSDLVVGNNIGYTPDDDISYNFTCGEVENSRWYTFSTGKSDKVEIELSVTNCKNEEGLELAIYDENFNLVTSCLRLKDGSSLPLLVDLRSNTLYHLIIDGMNGDECDYELRIDRNRFEGPVEFSHYPDDQNYCLGLEVCFEVEPNSALDKYYWSLPSQDSIISGGGLNDWRACIHFKKSESKNIGVRVESQCGVTNEFSTPIFVKPDQIISIDTMYSDRTVICEDDPVVFSFDWKYQDDMEFDWKVSGPLSKVEGGGKRDTFFKGETWNNRDFTISVTPDHTCGFRYELSGYSISNLPVTNLSGIVCQDSCFPIGDKCLTQPNNFNVNTGITNSIGCDSIVNVSLEFFEVMPSPLLECNPTENGFLVEWPQVSGAEQYTISIERDSFTTTTDNFLLLENIAMDSIFDIKVQPTGLCTYLPGEMTCNISTSNIKTGITNNEITIFPNPTTDKINIETDLKIQSVEVFNVAGRFLQKEKTASFNLKNQESGIYFLKIKTKEGVAVKRILLNSLK